PIAFVSCGALPPQRGEGASIPSSSTGKERRFPPPRRGRSVDSLPLDGGGRGWGWRPPSQPFGTLRASSSPAEGGRSERFPPPRRGRARVGVAPPIPTFPRRGGKGFLGPLTLRMPT